MIVRRITGHLKKQHWTAVFLDLAIVVLGVFIGLQVNNWSEARNEQRTERAYLERLRVDFDANVKELQSFIDGRRSDGKTLSELAIALHDGGTPPSVEALQSPLCRWGAPPLPALRQGTYNELVSSGRLSLLRDERLRTLLADYSAAEDRSIYVGTLLPVVLQGTASLDGYRSWVVTSKAAATRNGAVGCDFNIAGMQRDPRIASAVAQLFRYQKLHENFRRAELDSALAVKARLDQLIGTNR